MADILSHRQPQNRISKSQPKPKKLPRLPSSIPILRTVYIRTVSTNTGTDAQISKRPLLRPPLASPYSGTQQQKVVYISAKTPFLSAVKRVEKLLHLSDQRLVQSATTLAKQNRSKGRGKRKRGARDTDGDGDEILEIAEAVERQKRQNKGGGEDGGEDVVLKGTGKAIQKVMELGLWFQQREEYIVRLRTRSVAAIDDITVDEDATADITAENQDPKIEPVEEGADAEAGAADEEDEAMDVDTVTTTEGRDHGTEKPEVLAENAQAVASKDADPIPETRIRYTSSLEVAVRLR